MKAVIMAGGLGTRLKPFTEVLPKPLLPLGEKSIIEIIIGKLRDSGVTDIILAVRYKSDLLESYLGNGSKYGVSLTYIKEEEPLGTAGPLSLMKNLLTEPFIVTNGDILTNIDFKDLVEFHNEHLAAMTVVTKEIDVPLNYGVVSSEGHLVTSVEEKPTLNFNINAGIYVISPSVVSILEPNVFFLMTDLFKMLVNDNRKVVRYPLQGYWLDMGKSDDYEKAREDVKNGLFH